MNEKTSFPKGKLCHYVYLSCTVCLLFFCQCFAGQATSLKSLLSLICLVKTLFTDTMVIKKKKIGSCYPCLCKTYTNSQCILNKIQIPLRSHFLSCLSQSLFSNVPDQLSIHIKILASGPLHFLAPLPGVHFSLNLIRLFPFINQNSVLSRCLITSSLQIIHYHITFTLSITLFIIYHIIYLSITLLSHYLLQVVVII